MIDVRIEGEELPWAGRCWFCWRRLSAERVQAVVYEDGEPLNGLACADCLALDDAALRGEMRDTADYLVALAEELRSAASNVIRRPAVGTLEHTRTTNRENPVVVTRIVAPLDDPHGADDPAAWRPAPGSLDAFLAAHVPCLLVDQETVLLRIEADQLGAYAATGICGRCGMTEALTLVLTGDRVAADWALQAYIASEHVALFTRDDGQPDLIRLTHVDGLLRDLMLETHDEYLERHTGPG